MKCTKILFLTLCTMSSFAQEPVRQGLQTDLERDSIGSRRINLKIDGNSNYESGKVASGLDAKASLTPSLDRITNESIDGMTIIDINKKSSSSIPLQIQLMQLDRRPVFLLPNGMIAYSNLALGLWTKYNVTKNLHLGIGAEPTYTVLPYVGANSRIFDMPIYFRTGYESKRADVSLLYKINTVSTVTPAPLMKLDGGQLQLRTVFRLY